MSVEGEKGNNKASSRAFQGTSALEPRPPPPSIFNKEDSVTCGNAPAARFLYAIGFNIRAEQGETRHCDYGKNSETAKEQGLISPRNPRYPRRPGAVAREKLPCDFPQSPRQAAAPDTPKGAPKSSLGCPASRPAIASDGPVSRPGILGFSPVPTYSPRHAQP
ncbi:hypothetical protein GW7_02438 [Heterocephalus glaber]|uniref:Uncharacterized protein n=1 Tax=Heterocephalus glaber TaxID=10181 RepID=G5CAM6_HETGA|nr:hypothetical protein GW7_02438 [Heterocephalus glaber]